ncbi:MAG TPA: tetratricopeptide repeat protein [Pyrinomonadaceae bacterium]|nr:tetratricopeptide repeat protein [Pyrinomonadaceae bacterium]
MSEEQNNFFKTNRELIVFTVLSVLVLLIYWQTTRFGFINLDDNQYVYENPAVRSGLSWESLRWALTAFHSANWHPLTWISHILDTRFFGLNAGGHHATNIIFHLINSSLAFAVFRKMTGCFWKSAIVAALFAVHPAHVESVAWISERKDVLSTMFWLLTMFAYVRYAFGAKEKGRKGERETNFEPDTEIDKEGVEKINETTEKAEEGEPISPSPFLPFSPSYLLVLVLFALGLMAKPMLVTLPFVLLLIDFWSLERLKTLKDLPALLIEKIPLFVLSAVSAYLTILAQRRFGAVETLEFLPFGTRFLNAVMAYVKYVLMLFYPSDLAVWYPYDRNFPAWQIGGAAILLLGITAFCVWQIRERKYLLMGWLWFLGTLVPVIGIVQVGSQSLADRYTYVPYFGLFIMLVWGIGDLLKSKKAFFAGFAIAVIVFAGLSFRQTSFWKDNETLYRRTLAVTKDNFLISHNLCYTLTFENRLDEAEPLCRTSIALNPNFFEAYNTLGILQLKRGQNAEAEQSFQEALRLAPGYALGNANLSVAQALLGKPVEAEASLEKAVRLSGNSVPPEVWINALNDLAIAYTAQKNYEKAAENLARILAIDFNNAPARGNLALTFYQLKRYDEAQKLIESAIVLNPNEAVAYNTYGLILLDQNRRTEAAGLFEKALQLKPDFPEAKENLKRAKGEK